MIAAVVVKSSNIDAVGYDKGDLYIRFLRGQVYRYPDVPFSTYCNLIAAESVGQFFHRNIKTRPEYEQLAIDPFATPEKH